MALPPRKTYPELSALTAPVVDGDVLAAYRSPGPLRRLTASTFADYIKAFFSASGGSALVGFLQAGTGAVLRTMQSKARDFVNVRDFGAVGNGTTDDYPAFQAALDYIASLSLPTCRLYVPDGKYRLSAKLNFYNNIRLTGDGWGQNPGIVDGVTYPYPTNWYGSLLILDAGVSALEFFPFTTEESVAAVIANPSLYYTLPSSYGSVVENIFIVSMSNGVAGAQYGVKSRTKITLRNVGIYGFPSDGLWITATSDIPDGNQYGNANMTVLENLICDNNGRDGVRLQGRDANGMSIVNLDCRNNGAWGLNMESLLSNNVCSGHFDGNNRLLAASGTATVGSIRTTSAVGAHMLSGIYIEPFNGRETDLTAVTTVVGGLATSPLLYAESSPAFVLNAGQAIRKGLSGLNTLGAVDVLGGMGRDPSGTAGNVALWFGDVNNTATMDSYRLSYQFQWTGIWTLNFGNSAQTMEFVTGLNSVSSQTYGYAVGFPNGIRMGTANSAPALCPSASAMPTTGTFKAGDIVMNSAPSVTTGRLLMGWMRLTSGTGHVLNTDWSGLWVPIAAA